MSSKRLGRVVLAEVEDEDGDEPGVAELDEVIAEAL
jgi:hypothetical protein